MFDEQVDDSDCKGSTNCGCQVSTFDSYQVILCGYQSFHHVTYSNCPKILVSNFKDLFFDLCNLAVRFSLPTKLSFGLDGFLNEAAKAASM